MRFDRTVRSFALCTLLAAAAPGRALAGPPEPAVPGAYEQAARWLGVEPAAALLTLLSQAALVACAWALARSILPALPALLGVAVLLALIVGIPPAVRAVRLNIIDALASQH